MDKEELKTCPSGHSDVEIRDDYEDEWVVWCVECGWHGPTRSTENACIKAWNNRKQSKKLQIGASNAG